MMYRVLAEIDLDAANEVVAEDEVMDLLSLNGNISSFDIKGVEEVASE